MGGGAGGGGGGRDGGGGGGGGRGGRGGRGGAVAGGGLGAAGGPGAPGAAAATKPLSTEQLRSIFQEAAVAPSAQPGPGKVNLNTASAKLLRDVLQFDPKVADQIVHMRRTRKQGITSLVDLMEIKDITPQTLRAIEGVADTTSNVYSISSRGRSAATGLEVEIFAVVDRSTLPVRILEYREQ